MIDTSLTILWVLFAVLVLREILVCEKLFIQALLNIKKFPPPHPPAKKGFTKEFQERADLFLKHADILVLECNDFLENGDKNNARRSNPVPVQSTDSKTSRWDEGDYDSRRGQAIPV